MNDYRKKTKQQPVKKKISPEEQAGILARDERYMRHALELAKKAAELGEVPVGAVVVRGDKVISEAYNLRETGKNALAHAELMAMDKACAALGGWRLRRLRAVCDARAMSDVRRGNHKLAYQQSRLRREGREGGSARKSYKPRQISVQSPSGDRERRSRGGGCQASERFFREAPRKEKITRGTGLVR